MNKTPTNKNFANKNPLKELETLGQSIWLDYIKRDMLHNGQLKQFITEDGLRGMTSNPNIFEKAIIEGKDYQSDILTMLKSHNTIEEIYAHLTQTDIRKAADEFRPVFDRLDGKDGFVSLEVNPHLAYDTQGTIQEARSLWKSLNRPNVFIKVPATKEGLPAITQLTSEGINVNVTLLFGLERYREVAEAYIAGIEQRIDNHKPVDHIASVASFFLSRIDVLVDPLLEKIMKLNNEQAQIAKRLHGQIAIASAKIAYQMYQEIFNSKKFKKLAERGARTQRVLWASTSTKNPAYEDIKYVEGLIGPETINTLPLETLNAYRDHGNPKIRIDSAVDEATWAFEQLPSLGIDIEKVTQQLEEEGVDKFSKAYDHLMESLNELSQPNQS